MGDFKQAVASGVRVGAAAVFVTTEALLRRAGDANSLSNVMADFAREQDVDVLFAMTAKDKHNGDFKGLVLLAAGGGASLAAARALEVALAAIPSGLPDSLTSEPLFQSQGVASEGFGIRFTALTDESGLRVSLVRPSVTRKTLLPAILHFCSAAAV